MSARAGKPKSPKKAVASLEAVGSDTEGGKYKNVGEMWEAQLKDDQGRKSWYDVGAKYWHGQQANINGVLGGYPETHGPDLKESKRFIEALRLQGFLPPSETPSAPSGAGPALRVLDCGAGIGRVTSGLLLQEFGLVDLVEPNERLLEAARKELGEDPRVGKFMVENLQSLEIPAESYDVIWAQWVLLYLPDDDLVSFFERCVAGLQKSAGLICVKENAVIDGGWMLDKEDNSITRTDSQYKEIFEKVGLDLVYEMQQDDWPQGLMPLMMYALRPKAAAGRVNAQVAKGPVDGLEPLSVEATAASPS